MLINLHNSLIEERDRKKSVWLLFVAEDCTEVDMPEIYLFGRGCATTCTAAHTAMMNLIARREKSRIDPFNFKLIDSRMRTNGERLSVI